MGYIDDSYLQGDTIRECQTDITDTCCLFTKLGFIIHPVKSVLRPVQTLVFLGFVLNSVSMTVCLPTERFLESKSGAVGLFAVPPYLFKNLQKLLDY